MSAEQALDHEEFDTLQMMLDWWKCEWGDEHDPIPTKATEDYEMEEINQPKGLSGTEV